MLHSSRIRRSCEDGFVSPSGFNIPVHIFSVFFSISCALYELLQLQLRCGKQSSKQKLKNLLDSAEQKQHLKHHIILKRTFNQWSCKEHIHFSIHVFFCCCGLAGGCGHWKRRKSTEIVFICFFEVEILTAHKGKENMRGKQKKHKR